MAFKVGDKVTLKNQSHSGEGSVGTVKEVRDEEPEVGVVFDAADEPVWYSEAGLAAASAPEEEEPEEEEDLDARTVEDLRDLAARENVDLTGMSHAPKGDIVKEIKKSRRAQAKFDAKGKE